MTKPYNPRDKFSVKAQKEGKRARSFFKLEEIDKKLHLFGPGMRVLDLGAAPGSFMQYVVKIIGPTGYLLGIDLQKINPLGQPYVKTLEQDIFADETKKYIQTNYPTKFDYIMSDLAPKTTGMKDIDHWNSVELSEEVLNYCKIFLKPGGGTIIKIFHGEEFDKFVKYMKTMFKEVKVHKPDASRDRSRETYLIGIGFKISNF